MTMTMTRLHGAQPARRGYHDSRRRWLHWAQLISWGWTIERLAERYEIQHGSIDRSVARLQFPAIREIADRDGIAAAAEQMNRTQQEVARVYAHDWAERIEIISGTPMARFSLAEKKGAGRKGTVYYNEIPQAVWDLAADLADDAAASADPVKRETSGGETVTDPAFTAETIMRVAINADDLPLDAAAHIMKIEEQIERARQSAAGHSGETVADRTYRDYVIAGLLRDQVVPSIIADAFSLPRKSIDEIEPYGLSEEAYEAFGELRRLVLEHGSVFSSYVRLNRVTLGRMTTARAGTRLSDEAGGMSLVELSKALADEGFTTESGDPIPTATLSRVMSDYKPEFFEPVKRYFELVDVMDAAAARMEEDRAQASTLVGVVEAHVREAAGAAVGHHGKRVRRQVHDLIELAVEARRLARALDVPSHAEERETTLNALRSLQKRTKTRLNTLVK